MKNFKNFLILILFSIGLFFTSSKNVNAKVMLCKYQGKVYIDYVNSTLTSSDLLITLEDDYIHIKFDAPYYYRQESQDWNISDGINTMMTGNDWSANFGMTHATSLLETTLDWDVFDKFSHARPINWTDASYQTDFLNKGYCPPVVSFGFYDEVDWTSRITGMGEINFVLGDKIQYGNHGFTWDEVLSYYKTHYDELKEVYSNTIIANFKDIFYLFPDYLNFLSLVTTGWDTTYFPYNEYDGEKGVPETLFSDLNNSVVSDISKTCSTDAHRIQYVRDVFKMQVPNFFENPTNTEINLIASYYKGNSYDVYAQEAISTYAKDSTCYTSNPAYQGLYDELVEAASWSLNHMGDNPVDVDDCEKIIGSGSFAKYLNQTLDFIQFIGPAIVILLSIIEYIKVAAASDAELLKKTNKRTVIRLIAAAMLFLAPILIRVILNIFGFYGDCLDSIL